MAGKLAFAAGFARGAQNVTGLLFQKRLREKEAEAEEQRKIDAENRLFGRQQDITAEERQAEKEKEERIHARGFLERYGITPGAAAPLGPGEQGPTPAGPADIAKSIQGAPAFLAQKAETETAEKIRTDENIRQAQAVASIEKTLTVADQLRLAGDIQKAYADAYDQIDAAIASGGEGARVLDQYRPEGGNDLQARMAAATAIAKPVVDQMLALVPPELSARIRGSEGTNLAGVETIRLGVQDALDLYDDPLKARAALEEGKAELVKLGATFTPEELARFEAAIAEKEIRAAANPPPPPPIPIVRGGLPNIGAATVRAGGGAVGAVQGALGIAAPAAPLLHRLAGGAARGREPAFGPQAKPKKEKGRSQVKTINPQEERLAALKAEEATLLSRARQDLALGGAIRTEIEQELRRVQIEITRLGGLPARLEQTAGAP